MVRAILRFVACVVLTFLIVVTVASAKGREQSLLALVPPGSRLVAGMSAPTTPGQPASYLLLTRNNRVDLEDFFALTGVDSTRVIHQVVLAAGGPADNLSEHSLLARGYFDRARIWKAAIANGASTTEWKDVPVVVMAPFAREHGVVQQARWLAIPRPELAILGSEASVRQELERARAGSAPDGELSRRLGQLRTDDGSWCVISALPARDEIGQSLEAFHPALSGLLHAGDGFAFGTKFGSKVEFEYEVMAGGSARAKSIAAAVGNSLVEAGSGSITLDQQADERGGARGVVKVSRSRYEEWLARVEARGSAETVAASH